MLLPLEPVLDSQFFEQVLHIRVSAEKDVQPRLVRVAVLVAPCGNFPTEEVSTLEDDRDVACVGDVFGRREAGEAFEVFWGLV